MEFVTSLPFTRARRPAHYKLFKLDSRVAANARCAAFIGSPPDGGTSLTSVIGRALPLVRGKRLEARAPIDGKSVVRLADAPVPRRAERIFGA
jgi:hypothetical protein